MKKIFLSISLILSSLLISAQDSTCTKTCNNKLQSVLPEAGEFSLGFDAVPVLNYFGNMFNSSSNTASIGYQEGSTIVGSYMKDSNTAYRGKLRIGFMNSSVDSTTEVSSEMTFGGGIQKYRGKTRLQGIYGAESQITFSNGSVTISGAETKKPNNFSFGIRTFVGVQYFVAKKIAVGAEYGWGPTFSKSDSNSVLNLDVDNASGGIYLTAFF